MLQQEKLIYRKITDRDTKNTFLIYGPDKESQIEISTNTTQV